MKDLVLVILKGVMIDFKRRCEQSTWEQDRDTYSKWHGQIKTMIDTIENGGVK